jgi:type II secretory pathway component PulF
MYYPAFILAGLVVAGFIMMTFVVPKLTAVLTETGAELPWTTKLLVGTSAFFVDFWWVVLLLAGAAGGFLFWFVRTPEGHRFVGLFSINLPIFGGIFKRLAVVRMVRSMRTLLEGGVDTVTALEISAEVVGNDLYRELILETAREVRDGQPLSSVFAANTKVVPAMVSQMLAVGEETGKLTEILGRLGDFYSREIDNLIGGLVTLIEPIIIVLIGVAVAIMVAAIILPMYTMSQSF